MDKPKSGCTSATLGFLLGAVISGIVFFVIGAVIGNVEVYHNIGKEESEIANEVIASNPDFSGLHPFAASDGTVQFMGNVPSEESYSKLKAAIIDHFGRNNLKIRMIPVGLASDRKPVE